MKLRNKLLTVLPVATISVLTPVVVSSCACSSSLTIKFRESINCDSNQKDNKEIKYHSIDDIKTACKTHIDPVTTETKMSQGDLDVITFSSNEEYFYWDLAYSYASKNIGYLLIWPANGAKGKIGNNEFSSLNYKFNGENVFIYSDAGVELIQSHCLALVTKG